MGFRGKIKTVVSVLAALVLCLLPSVGCAPEPSAAGGKWLRDKYAGLFPVGAAVMTYSLERYEDILPHFNSITAENDMKWRLLEKTEGQPDYTTADALVAWAKEHDTAVRGHCLLWYKSLPSWLPAKVTDKQTALDVIDSHIKETMTHFGGDIYAWDVVNEALKNTVTQDQLERGEIWRTGTSEVVSTASNTAIDWYELCGEDFIKQAFRSADETRKELGLENIDLYYNDYSLNNPYKREACVRLVKMLQREGIAIDGVGMQAHYRLPNYTKDKQKFLKDFEDSVKAFTELGVDVQITELDICVYASKDDKQEFDRLPLEVESAQAEMFGAIFDICRKYATPWKEGAGRVSGVTTWGVADLNNAHNTAMHREYPLLFSTDKTEKRAYYEIIDF